MNEDIFGNHALTAITMPYLLLEFIHILSSTVLFDTGIGIASVMLYSHITKDTKIITPITRYVMIADWVFTAAPAFLK